MADIPRGLSNEKKRCVAFRQTHSAGLNHLSSKSRKALIRIKCEPACPEPFSRLSEKGAFFDLTFVKVTMPDREPNLLCVIDFK
ncbi:MAG: hypothetical protein KZQ95_21120 [Candidatus Thiodiazotropha sp. (ex Epidulcina cf. delphinae)]|nr:hypothetical protein [Candidatus Thiodiazotropha sp. (ex Epidulcina cf. delphinae)]